MSSSMPSSPSANRPRRGRRRAAVATAGVLGLTAAGAGLAAQAAGTPPPTLRLVAAATSVQLFEFDSSFADYGTNLIVGDRPVVVEVSRPTIRDPFSSVLVLGDGDDARRRPLPAGSADATGLKGFLQLTFRNQAGAVVRRQTQDWVPGGGFFGDSVRYRPEAPDTSPWPNAAGFDFLGTGENFALSNVFGLQEGWASPTAIFDPNSRPLPVGSYTLTETVAPAWRSVLGIKAADATATVRVTVLPNPEGGGGVGAVGSGTPGAAARAGLTARTASSSLAGTPLTTAQAEAARQARIAEVAAAAGGRQTVLSTDPAQQRVPDRRPDLRSNPAFGVTIRTSEEFPTDPSLPIVPPNHDFLSFAATVWNGGSSPLVVEGARTPGADLMQARQFFYDRKGRQLGWTPVGSMQYDPKLGHQHWHFLDFAQYNLLSRDRKQVVRSQKEAFCLAPTDALDLLNPDASWNPGSIGLGTRCGGQTAIGIREVLDVGWGDTYVQDLPGQSFDITDLPNGTYLIQVKANPVGNLFETDTSNNESLRTVVLGGRPGARTVKVPPIVS